MAGAIKSYDVGGKEVDGRVMPAGTRLRLNDEDAERLGLKRSSRTEERPEDSALVTSKKAAPRSAKRASPRPKR